MSATKTHPSYLSAKIELRPVAQKGGFGLFARETLAKDETLAVWGGVIVSEAELGTYSDYARTHG